MKNITDPYKTTSTNTVSLAIQFPEIVPCEKFVIRPKKGRPRTVIVEIKRS